MDNMTIHNYPHRLEVTRQRIQESNIPAENKRLLLDFDRYCVAEGLGPGRRVKLLGQLIMLAERYTKRPFKATTAKQIRDMVFEIESSDLAPWTKRDYKFGIKKLFKFVEWGHGALQRKEYPPRVAGINATVKRRDQVRVQAADIISPEEVERLLAATKDSQQRALLSIMYELGARVSEIGTMCVGSVSRDQYSYICDLNGKTGPRSVRVIRSAGALTAWLNVHPRRNNSDAPLWGRMRKGEWTALTYSGIKGKVRAAVEDAGITKRVYQHLLRHTRITHVLASGQMNEAQIKKFFGLAADSSMLAVYGHLVSKDANDAALRMHGIIPEEKPAIPPPLPCGMCGEFNDEHGQFCARCGYALRVDAAKDPIARMDDAGERISRFLRQPEIEQAFRAMVREEIRAALARTLPLPAAPPAAPTRERTPARPAA